MTIGTVTPLTVDEVRSALHFVAHYTGSDAARSATANIIHAVTARDEEIARLREAVHTRTQVDELLFARVVELEKALREAEKMIGNIPWPPGAHGALAVIRAALEPTK